MYKTEVINLRRLFGRMQERWVRSNLNIILMYGILKFLIKFFLKTPNITKVPFSLCRKLSLPW